MKCTLCPRNCNIDRTKKTGVCRTNGITISRVSVHMWEEPCISGSKGSGTVFFAGCNLHCRFCQNYDISVKPHGAEVYEEKLADTLLYVQDSFDVANINLVTPTHFSDGIAKALSMVKSRLRIPVVYNTSSYEKTDALKRLDGLVDVYLPDLKFYSSKVSADLANAPDYFEVASAAIAEMRRQQSKDVFVGGYMTNGVIVRHLVLPTFVEDSKRVLDWIRGFDKTMYVSIMSQYFPARTDGKFPQLNRRLYAREYKSVLEYFDNLGLVNGYCQDVSSATAEYLPDFDDTAIGDLLAKVPRVYS